MNEEEKNFDLTDEFLEEAARDTEISEFNLKEQLRVVVNKTQRYIEAMYQQKRQLKKMELYVKKKKGELYEYYKKDFEITLTSSTDIMIFVERDKKYQTAKKMYDCFETNVDFLDKTIKNMTQKIWALRSMVDLEKNNL